MKNILLLSILLVAVFDASAQQPTVTNININNIDAKVSSTSDLFWDFINPGFEVPQGSGKHAIYAAGLWISGLDSSGNLYLAGQTYRQTGYDFQPGPIDTINGIPANPNVWNESWKLNQSEVNTHIQMVGTVNYVVPANIADWPGYNAALGRVLAPFADVNSNGLYDPQNGDYPFIMGDQTVYSIYNDMLIHTETSGPVVGVEVHRTMFGFDEPSDPILDNSIFSRYEIKNYSNTDYQDFYVTLWTDFDLGFSADDYVGTDIGLDMVYAYNGDSFDDGTNGYGANPPAIGVYLLNATLASSLAYDNINNDPSGNPNGYIDFRNYSIGIWLDNQPVTYGGDGNNPGNPVTTYMYPDTTNTFLFPSHGTWNEAQAGNSPGDRRILASIGPFNLPAQGYLTFDAGYTFAQASSGGPLASLAMLQDYVGQLRIMYDNGVLTSVSDIPSQQNEVNAYPNPVSEILTVNNNNPGKPFTLILYDVAGKQVYSQVEISDAQLKIDVKGFAKGIYILSVLQGEQEYHSKLVIR